MGWTCFVQKRTNHPSSSHEKGHPETHQRCLKSHQRASKGEYTVIKREVRKEIESPEKLRLYFVVSNLDVFL